MKKPSHLKAEDVASGYGAAEILHGVNLHIQKDEIVTVLGPNGSGKSTLFKTIMGYLPARNGTISFDGMDITNLSVEQRVRKGIGYVPQLSNVFLPLTVRENLLMGGCYEQEKIN